VFYFWHAIRNPQTAKPNQMFKTHFKIAWRSLGANKFYTVINLAGLSIGITVFILVVLFRNYENSYDRWYPSSPDLYRVVAGEQNEEGLQHSPSVQYPLGTFLQQENAAVELLTRVRVVLGERVVSVNGEDFFESKIIQADSNFFTAFQYPFVQGNRQKALSQPNMAVITTGLSKKWFGEQGALGKTFTCNRQLYTITGVIEKPGPSHLDFSICLSYHSKAFEHNWFMRNHDTYVVLNPKASVSDLQKRATDIFAKHYAQSYTDGSMGMPIETNDPVKWLEKERGISNLYILFEPVTGIHLNPIGFAEWSSKLEVYDFDVANNTPVVVFSLVGVLVLLLACINYTNMAIAQGFRRAKESGMRKIMGASRRQLMAQYILEAFLLSLISCLVAIALAELLAGVINSTFQLQLSMWNNLNPVNNLTLFLQLAGILILVTLVSGAYPAFVLSNFKPLKVLKGNVAKTVKGKFIRNSLVVFQYSIASCFIICLLIVTLQLAYMRSNDPGFDTTQVLRIQQNEILLFPGHPDDRSEYVIDNLKQIAGVTEVSSGENYPGMSERSAQSGSYDDGQSIPLQFSLVNYDYFNVLGMKIIKGRDFSRAFSTDSAHAAIINETAAHKMGWKDPIGKSLRLMNHEYQIIGLAEDTHFSGYENAVQPLMYMMGVDERRNFSGHNQVFIKIDARNTKQTLADISAFWKKLEPGYPVRYSWLDQDFARLLEKHERFGKLTSLLTLSALTIAVIGIFALSAFSAQQRTKEVGIRKVLGASVTNIITMLSSDFVRLAVLAIILAIPVAGYAMNAWLSAFSYKIEVTWWMFAAGSGVAVSIALFTAALQAVQTASLDPVKSLKDE
jgi:putative ABC transport system permease protein